MKLSITKLRGQCYDGCITMSGTKTGVAERISDEEPRTVFTHCYDHSLSLSASDTMTQSLSLSASDTMTQLLSLLASDTMKQSLSVAASDTMKQSLSLAASDTMKQSRVMKNALDTTHEITKLIKFSPKCDDNFRGLKAEHNALHENCSAGIRFLCPTGWTVKADSLQSISYKQLLCIT